MNIQAIYDRLHRDLCIREGEIPPLYSSRAPAYEAFWKRLLAAIEEIGHDPLTGCLCYSAWPKGRDGSITIDSESCEVFYGMIERGSPPLVVPVELVAWSIDVLQNGNPFALRAIRQVCLFTYKSKSHEVTKEQRETAISGFKARNSRCRELSWSYYQLEAGKSTALGETLRVAKVLFNVATVNWDVREIIPRHGPGAVCDSKRDPLSKWRCLDGAACRITDKFYPVSDYFTPTPASFDYTQARFVDPFCKLAIVP